MTVGIINLIWKEGIEEREETTAFGAKQKIEGHDSNNG
jgi:hypothetical protein